METKRINIDIEHDLNMYVLFCPGCRRLVEEREPTHRLGYELYQSRPRTCMIESIYSRPPDLHSPREEAVSRTLPAERR